MFCPLYFTKILPLSFLTCKFFYKNSHTFHKTLCYYYKYVNIYIIYFMEGDNICMNSKQRAYLRSLANNIDPIFFFFLSGLSENLLKQIDDALEARELIKITVLDSVNDDILEIGNIIAEKTSSVFVQALGKKLTFYRHRNKGGMI